MTHKVKSAATGKGGRELTRLSSPITELSGHANVVVIGSGYGGAITASRLARAGQQVWVLERGRELHPGEFPDTPPEALTSGQILIDWGALGNRTGLFDIRTNGDINVLMGCGLGGTSLINANVALPADPWVFTQDCWPKELRESPAVTHKNHAELDTYYQRATKMLSPERLPERFRDLPKLNALESSAERLNAKVKLLPVNVTFDDGANAAGIHQQGCTLCGDCISGCNEGSKNSLLMNYLPDAVGNGAKVFTKVSVHHLSRRDGRWVLHCEMLDTGQELFDAPYVEVMADIVVVAAGSLGSTEILLRSRDKGLALSGALGTKFTGNGDVLGFSFNGDRPVDGVGWGPRRPDRGGTCDKPPRVGPCITAAIDLREGNQDQGIIIEDGSLPGALAPALLMAFESADQLGGTDTEPGLLDEIGESARKIQTLVRGPYTGAIRNTLTYLVMSHDGADGRLVLDDDRVSVSWPRVDDRPIFKNIEERLVAASAAQNGTYVENPLRQLMGDRLTTVHPLGGCPMGEDAAAGVVNHKGQAFSGVSGDDVYESLYVSDGAVIPCSLGVNPLMTISALAERTVQLMADDRGWNIDIEKPTPPLPQRPERAIGIQFSERMIGSLTLKKDGLTTAATAVLTVAAENLRAFINDPDRLATVAGTVDVPGLSHRPMTIGHGRFNFLVKDPDRVDMTHMTYQANLTDADGRTLFLNGHKDIHDDSGFDLWSDTTTLFTDIHDGADARGPILASGVLRISVADFSRELRSIRVTGTHDVKEILAAQAFFGYTFAKELYSVYGGVGVSRFLDHNAPIRRKRTLRAPTPTVHSLTTADGVTLKLTRYQGGAKGPVMLTHGLGVNSQIFTTDTIETNLVEYLCKYGYDVWVLDYRVSTALATARDQYTADDVAVLDYPAAVDEVRSLTGAPSIQVIAHCYGATTFTMAMLAGLQGVRAAVISQISTHIVSPPWNRLKGLLHVPTILDRFFDTLSTDAHRDEPLWQKISDQALKLWPLPAEEKCKSPVCHRISFLYGLLYEHDQLNTDTHDLALAEMFGEASMAAFRHLTTMIRSGTVVAADGSDRYMPHLDRMALPLTIIHGAENRCFLPESTQKTVAALAAANGAHWYRRHIIPNYGHIDCIYGKDAARDVYGKIIGGLEPTAKVP